MAVLEADALALIDSSADRLEFYKEILLPAIRSNVDSKLLDSNNNNAIPSMMSVASECPLITTIHSKPFDKTVITHERQFNEMVQKIDDAICIQLIARKIKSETNYANKKVKTEAKQLQTAKHNDKIAEKEKTEAKPLQTAKHNDKRADKEKAISDQLQQKKFEDYKRQIDEIVEMCIIAYADTLFDDISKRRICEICLASNDKVYKCAGPCIRSYHKTCITETNPCQNCDAPKRTNCFTCNNNGTIHRNERIHCIHCMAIYHQDSKCIPAGATILSESQMICPRHHTGKTSISFNRCSICSLGGKLISCQSCPVAFHAKCIGDRIDGKRAVCDRCESGVLAVYGEIVWVKYHQYPWWPG